MLTRTSVRVHDRDSFLACSVLEEAFLGTIVACASKPSKVENHGDLLLGIICGLGWEVEIQGHFAASGGGIVNQF